MICLKCKQNILDPNAIECPHCGDKIIPLDEQERAWSEKYREVLRQRIALEGRAAELNNLNQSLTAKVQNAKPRFIIWTTLLGLIILYLFSRKTTPPPIAPPTALLDSLTYFKMRNQILETQKPKSVKYVIRPKDNDEVIGALFYNDPKAGIQIIKDNGIDTSTYSLRHLKTGDTIKIIFR